MKLRRAITQMQAQSMGVVGSPNQHPNDVRLHEADPLLGWDVAAVLVDA